MDQLEKYIQNNRDAFDEHLPLNDLWLNIETGLQSGNKIRLKYLITKIAAAIIIIIGSGVAFNMIFVNDNLHNQPNGLSTEVYEVAVFYESQINQKRDELFTLTSNIPEIKKETDIELALLDSALNDLKLDLKDNVANEEVIEAMIQNYRLKLQILEDILNYVKHDNDNSPKIETHEL
ncbi:MAG: hypothetical protein JW717_09270 [Marinilabiliaceae bacterium]|nr:hypothetical protein [Marinilabiliaceae bacterium]